MVNQYPELRFENKSRELKINFGLKSMGVGVGDYNNDTFLDYHVTNIFAGPFIVNRGDGLPFVNLMNSVGTGVNKIKSFIENGDKAKITLRFRGREMAHQQIGMELLKRVESDLVSLASVEQFPTLEGRQLVMMMAPNKKN